MTRGSRSFLLTYLALGITYACTDTPGWRNGWTNCRIEGWNSVHGCEPGGWTCAGYVQQGMCTGAGAGYGREWTLGATFNYPEKNCCACGKPDDVVADTCAVSSWGSWGACSASCGDGTQTRSGTGQSTEVSPCVDTPGWFNNNFLCRSEGFQGWQGCEPQGWTCYGYAHERMCIGNGPGPGMEVTLGWVFNNPELNCCVCGKQMPRASCSSTETRACNAGPCAVDCVGAWSSCDANCDEEFKISIDASGGGAECESNDGDKRKCAAGTDACPAAVNCVGRWYNCDVNCWQSFGITTYASGGGKECETYNGDIRKCAPGTDQCPPDKDCEVGLWTAWGACDSSCGEGVQLRTRQKTADQTGNGTCPYAFAETRNCVGNHSACPTDCVGDWGKCGANCKQTFTVTTHDVGGGWPCDHDNGDIRDCGPGLDDCPADSCAPHNGDKNGCKDAGCQWNKMTKLCTEKPLPTGCKVHKDPDSCKAVAGCKWKAKKGGKCQGTPKDPNEVSCKDLHNQKDACLALGSCKYNNKNKKCKAKKQKG